MSNYSIAYEPDLGCYPNYSFEIGDVDGDGRMELVSLDQSGRRLRVQRLDGSCIFERNLTNEGTWGTLPVAMVDLDGDGCCEIIVPHVDPYGRASLVVFDGTGCQLTEWSFDSNAKDAYGITIPLLKSFRATDGTGLIAGIAGGRVVALDHNLDELWRLENLRRDFGHEFHVADIDHDGADEVVFCTVDDICGSLKQGVVGELVLVDHDGMVLLRRSVSDYIKDTHFDDCAMADFLGNGTTQVLLEKGVLIDLHGNVRWDVSDQLIHGQWITHTSDVQRGGELIYIATLWDTIGTSAFFSGAGKKFAVASPPYPAIPLDGWHILATRPHFIQWTPDTPPELFVATQACSPTSHNCFATEHFELNAFFYDIHGNLLETLPFADAQIEGYWYNGEVSSRIADVDGDGKQEVIFPRQSGKVMVVKKRE